MVALLVLINKYHFLPKSEGRVKLACEYPSSIEKKINCYYKQLWFFIN